MRYLSSRVNLHLRDDRADCLITEQRVGVVQPPKKGCNLLLLANFGQKGCNLLLLANFGQKSECLTGMPFSAPATEWLSL